MHLILLSVTNEFHLTWHLDLIYDSPYLPQRSASWDQTEEALLPVQGPLICIGDFNQVLHLSDKLSSSSSTSIPGSTRFHQLLFNLGLSKVASSGPHFTWTNNRQNCIVPLSDWIARSAVVLGPPWGCIPASPTYPFMALTIFPPCLYKLSGFYLAPPIQKTHEISW